MCGVRSYVLKMRIAILAKSRHLAAGQPELSRRLSPEKPC
jgi:hypothetical protein